MINRRNLITQIIRILSVIISILVFGWYNVFTYFEFSYSSRSNNIVWFFTGLIYCTFSLLTSFGLATKNIFKIIYFLITSGIILVFVFDLLTSLIFGQTKIFIISLILLIIIVSNGFLVFKNISVLEKSHRVVWLVILISFLCVGFLSFNWSFFSTKISCEGASITTAGNHEKWSYILPRLQCWNFHLSE